MMRKIYQSNESSNEPLSDSNKTQVQRIQQILKASADRLPTQTWKEAEGILNELLGNSSFGFLKQFVTTAVEKLEEDCGKTVHVDISGEAFHLGDGQLRALQNCMVHIVRNAIDHGIENQDERVRFAKSPHGNLKVEFTVKGGLLNVSIQDDGKGLNYDKIREKIVNNGLASEDEVIAMNEGQLSEFIFKPGFTTADQVSEVSGRGMGLDAVRGDLELQEGKIWVESIAGKGTTFKIELPLSEQEAGLDQKDALKVAI
jgi:two-component system chemotaxis sensor kinase CheA